MNPQEASRYIVATDGMVLTQTQQARLYRETGYRARAELAATGTVAQMQQLADELNGEEAQR